MINKDMSKITQKTIDNLVFELSKKDAEIARLTAYNVFAKEKISTLEGILLEAERAIFYWHF